MQTTEDFNSMYSINEQLSNIICRLNVAVNVCHEAPDNAGQGSHYAVGFARSAMQGSLKSLEKLQQQLREVE